MRGRRFRSEMRPKERKINRLQLHHMHHMLINTTLGMSNLKAGKPFFGWNFFLQLFTNPSIVIKIINVKQMIIRKRKQF